MNLFQLYDLQKIEGKFECRARRAGVGPVTNLRTLVREHRQWGLVLDFVHYKHLRDLRPSIVKTVSARKVMRYLWGVVCRSTEIRDARMNRILMADIKT